MQKELDLLLPLVENPRSERTSRGRDFTTGQIGKHSVALMRSGIGKVNSALAVSDLIDDFKPDLVINSGVAGGAGGSAKRGDVVTGAEVCYHDVWCGPDTEWGVAAGCPPVFTPPAKVLDSKTLERTVKGCICSGDIFVTEAAQVAKIKEFRPDVQAVDMESASMAQACYMAGVDFVAIRVISDTPGENNVEQYLDFWEDAPKTTFRIISDLINELK